MFAAISGFGHLKVTHQNSIRPQDKVKSQAVKCLTTEALMAKKMSHTGSIGKSTKYGLVYGGSRLALLVAGIVYLAAAFFHKLRSWVHCPTSKQKLREKFREEFAEQWKYVFYEPLVNCGNEVRSPFEKAVIEFSKKIPKLAKDPNTLRAAIVKLSKYPEKENNPEALRFLQECAMRLEATPSKAFSEYGRGKLPEGPFTLPAFADGLLKAHGKIWTHRNHVPGTVAWGAMNFERLPRIVQSDTHPLEYDSYEDHAVFTHQLKDETGHSITLKFTPGLTGPQSVAKDLMIPALQEKNEHWIHINHQSVHKAGERQRIEEVERWAKESEGHFHHVVLSSDKPPYVMSVLNEFVDTPKMTFDAFMIRYLAALRGHDNSSIREFAKTEGIYIPAEILSDKELGTIFRFVTQAVRFHPKIQAYSKTEEGRKKLGMIVDTMINTTLSWAILKKHQRMGGYTLSMACKEGVDRGPQEICGMLVNDLLSQGKECIDSETAHLMAGLSLGKSLYAADRAPQIHRIIPHMERIRFLSEHGQKTMAGLSQDLFPNPPVA